MPRSVGVRPKRSFMTAPPRSSDQARVRRCSARGPGWAPGDRGGDLGAVPHGDDDGHERHGGDLLLGGPAQAVAEGESEAGLGEADQCGAETVVDDDGDEDAHRGGGDRVDVGLDLGGGVPAEGDGELDDDRDQGQPGSRLAAEDQGVFM